MAQRHPSFLTSFSPLPPQLKGWGKLGGWVSWEGGVNYVKWGGGVNWGV